MNLLRFCSALVISSLLLLGPSTDKASAAIPGDFNADDDVDLVDFAHFQACVLGSDFPQAAPACTHARLDADEDVDLDDFAVFQGCLSGADNPADPNCACASGETNCAGTCVDTASNNGNCGTCGNICEGALICQNGSCSLPSSCTILYCGGWVDTCNDSQNCGSCFHACAGNEYCSGGTCVPSEPCPDCRVSAVIPGDFDDDGDVDLADFVHFQMCALGPVIAQTAPECADARLDADSDVDLDDFEILQGCLSGAGNPADPNCSCPSGQTSCDGTCASDGERFLLCDGVCRDAWVDVGNCGGCGIVCGSGQTCVGAQCQDQEPCWDCGGG